MPVEFPTALSPSPFTSPLFRPLGWQTGRLPMMTEPPAGPGISLDEIIRRARGALYGEGLAAGEEFPPSSAALLAGQGGTPEGAAVPAGEPTPSGIFSAARPSPAVLLRAAKQIGDLLFPPAPSHARSPSIEAAWQAQRAGEFLPGAQPLLALGYSPEQARLALEVFGPIPPGMSDRELSLAMDALLDPAGRYLNVPGGSPRFEPQTAGQWADVAAREAAMGYVPPAAYSAPAIVDRALAQITSPASLMGLAGSIISSDPVVQRHLYETWGPELATAANWAATLASPFTFGLSTFAPAIQTGIFKMLGLADSGHYRKTREKAAQELQGQLPIIAQSLGYARGPQDLEFLFNLYNPWAHKWQLTPEGLRGGYELGEQIANVFNPAWQSTLGALRELWAHPDHPFFAERPTMQDFLRDQYSRMFRENWWNPLVGVEGMREAEHVARALGLDLGGLVRAGEEATRQQVAALERELAELRPQLRYEWIGGLESPSGVVSGPQSVMDRIREIEAALKQWPLIRFATHAPADSYGGP